MSFDAIKWAMEQPVTHSPAKFVLVAMANESRDSETVWISVATISEATAQDRKTVITNVGRLVSMGYIEDTGMRKGATKQVIVYRFKTPEIGTVEDSQKRDSTENGTVPVFPTNSTEFPSKDSQNSLLTVPNLGHEPVTPITEPVFEPVNLSVSEPSMFDRFWSAYPKKVAKPQCREKWRTKGLEKLGEVILADVEAKKAKDRRWADGYEPNPMTYLNQERWNDPILPKTAASGKPPIAQRFADKTYHGTPDDDLPEFLRTGTH